MFQTLIDCRVRTLIESNFLKKHYQFAPHAYFDTLTPSQKNIGLTFSKAFSS